MVKRKLQGMSAMAALLIGSVTACSGLPTATPLPDPDVAGGSDGEQRGFTLVASGDVLPHASIIRQAQGDAGGSGYDFAPMLVGAKSVVSEADLAICHMETVYGADGGPYTGYPNFKSPPEVAKGLSSTGYDSCSTASNHSLDAGADGIDRTLGALDEAGIKHVGSARAEAEAREPAWLKGGTAKVAQLAYTYGTNGYPLPEERPWAVNLMDQEKIVADARAARKAGADVVVVSLHWGTEWQDAPDDQQLQLGKALTASKTDDRPDIDLILGTHAHVPQAYEKVNGTWIIYGMGDQIAGPMVNHSGAHDPRGNQGAIGRFTFAPPARAGERWVVRKAEFIPQWFDTEAGRVVNLNAAIAGGADHSAVRDRIRKVVLSRGAGKGGLVMGQ
ncbi:CapA family protein [Streptomyces sp. ISL-100]|uniref:CapA family protein n=1 Tax=Streptomyces sp. ISL-100 TaxID=2819173 RepID=UPI001BE50591|nr:CapA family protein [Streptomyces sp. ISL-100]MBT2398363.1 CapA family protein [Streptomyces sp. ISL-100]